MNLIRHVSRRLATLTVVGAVATAGLTATPATASPDDAVDLTPAGITRVLDREARIPGTTWGVDPATGQVTVSYDDTVVGKKLARLTSVTGRFGHAVRTERVAGILDAHISGGDAIFTGTSRCTLGFNVRNSAGAQYFVTAGHCTNLGSSWYGSGNVFLGTRVGTSFPGNDYGIVRYDNSSVSRPGNVNLRNGTYRDITASSSAYAGQSVCHVGSTSGLHCGSIISLNNTVNYSQGTVYGLIRSNICSEPGDSGGPLFAGTTAIGLISGGSGNCSTGGTTYYQPISEVLTVYGMSVY